MARKVRRVAEATGHLRAKAACPQKVKKVARERNLVYPARTDVAPMFCESESLAVFLHDH